MPAARIERSRHCCRRSLAGVGGRLCALAALALWLAAATPRAPSKPADPFAALKATFARPDLRAPARRQPAHAGQGRARQAPVRGQGAVLDRHHRLRLLPRSQARPSPTASARGKGVTGKRAGAPHAVAVERGLEPAAVLGRPGLEPGGAGALSRRASRRDGRHARQRGRTASSRHESYERAFAEAFPGRSQHLGAQHRQGARRLRAHAGVAADALRPVGRRRRRRAVAARGRTACKLFTGKGRCINCHTGFAFTDHDFYDIGLPGDDKGRGAEIGLPAADHAFKTPTLRELAWTAPYMHDGSLGTLDDVVRIYEMGGVDRPTRSKDLPRNLQADRRRSAPTSSPSCETLSSETPPQPSTEAWVGVGRAARLPPPPKDTTVVSQADKLFTPAHVRLRRGPDADRAQRRHAHPQRAHLRSQARFQFRRAGAARRAITIRFPGRRHLRGLLRHPPLHAPDHRGAVTRASIRPRAVRPRRQTGRGCDGYAGASSATVGPAPPGPEGPVAGLPGNPVGLPGTLLGSRGLPCGTRVGDF